MNTLHIQFEMTPDPDTVIFGQTYKRIIEYNDEFGPWQEVERYYVRSTPDGKGYVFLLDSMAEFLTGDVTAVQGDTVEVLIKDQFWWGFGMQSTIVDSVVTLSNGGVTVTRHYLHTASSQGFLLPTDMFWQSGLGATQGPYLRLPTSLSEHLHCAFVAPNHVFFSSSIPMGSPGISCGCEPFPVSVAEVGTDQRTPIGLYPNPSTGSFRIRSERRSGIASVQAFDQTGRSVPVLVQNASIEAERTLELHAEMGIYMLRVSFNDGTVHVGSVCIER